jgi:hypothetical protein
VTTYNSLGLGRTIGTGVNNLSASDFQISVNSTNGIVTLNLPSISSILDERMVSGYLQVIQYLIADISGTAGTNKITIVAGAGDLINGVSSFDLDTDNISAILVPTSHKTWSLTTNVIAPDVDAIPYGNDFGNPSDYKVSIPDATLTAGYTFEMRVKTGNDNTGVSFLELNSFLKKEIVDSDLNSLVAGMIEGDSIYLFAYNLEADKYQLLGLAKPETADWELNGNTNGAIKSIGTKDAFDFPIIVNGVEVSRFTTDKRQFWNAVATNNGSNAGLQYNSLIANRAQVRLNQYGANNAGGGFTTFKSRGLVIGAPLALGDGVLVGDIITGITGIAVTGSGLLIPLAYTQRVTAVEVTAGNVACDWEISVCPIGGATNSIRKVFAVTSEGIQRVRESVNSMAGLAVLDATGNLVVPNTNIKATSRFLLTVQDGGVAPTGNVYVSARVVGTSFTITSNAGIADAGVQVYYQIYEQLT